MHMTQVGIDLREDRSLTSQIYLYGRSEAEQDRQVSLEQSTESFEN